MGDNVWDRIMNDQQLKDHWIKRVVGYIIDEVIIYVVMFIIILIGVVILVGAAIGGAMTGNALAGVVGGLLILIFLILVAILFSIIYWVYFDAHGGTPGKKIMNLRPVALEGDMTYVKAAIRNGSKIVGGFIGAMVENLVGIMFIGVIIASIIVLFDAYLGLDKGEDPRRKFTDFIAGTTVIRTDTTETFAPMPPPPTPYKPGPIPGAPSNLTATGVSASEPTQGAPSSEPTTATTPPATSAPAITPEPKAVTPMAASASNKEDKLRELRDKFLLGDITEKEYLSEKEKFAKET
ncbi:MAG: RDD family protein [Methanomassiliicoccales archaeon]|nr:MAG: RDD family protein [Methanomassiliicoccales archaeon]